MLDPQLDQLAEVVAAKVKLPTAELRGILLIKQAPHDAHSNRQSARQIKRDLEKILATYLPAPRN
jgi:hypothetical protein